MSLQHCQECRCTRQPATSGTPVCSGEPLRPREWCSPVQGAITPGAAAGDGAARSGQSSQGSFHWRHLQPAVVVGEEEAKVRLADFAVAVEIGAGIKERVARWLLVGDEQQAEVGLVGVANAGGVAGGRGRGSG